MANKAGYGLALLMVLIVQEKRIGLYPSGDDISGRLLIIGLCTTKDWFHLSRSDRYGLSINPVSAGIF